MPKGEMIHAPISFLLCTRHLYPANHLARPLWTDQKEPMIRPRLAREGRQLLYLGVNEPILIMAAWVSPVRDPLHVDVGVSREGLHAGCTSDGRDYHCLRPVL